MQIVSPCPDSVLTNLWEWMKQFDELMVDDNCPQNYEAMYAKHVADLKAGAQEFAVLSEDGTPLGVTWFESAGDGMYLGHLVFDRYQISTSDKLSAARQAIDSLFKSGARKIIWQMFADNRPFRIFLRRLGAEVEGTLRQGTRKNGQLKDIMLMASFPKESR